MQCAGSISKMPLRRAKKRNKCCGACVSEKEPSWDGTVQAKCGWVVGWEDETNEETESGVQIDREISSSYSSRERKGAIEENEASFDLEMPFLCQVGNDGCPLQRCATQS